MLILCTHSFVHLLIRTRHNYMGTEWEAAAMEFFLVVDGQN